MAAKRIAREGLGMYDTTEYEDWVVVTEKRVTDELIESPKMREKMPWYHGRMSRAIADDTLSKSARFDGTFLVRESEAVSVRSDPVIMISVMLDGQPHHVEVEKRPNGKYALANVRNAKEYKTIDKLVKHFQKKSMDLEGGGKTKLKYFMDH